MQRFTRPSPISCHYSAALSYQRSTLYHKNEVLIGEQGPRVDFSDVLEKIEGRAGLMRLWILYPVLVPHEATSPSGAPGNEPHPYLVSMYIVKCSLLKGLSHCSRSDLTIHFAAHSGYCIPASKPSNSRFISNAMCRAVRQCLCILGAVHNFHDVSTGVNTRCQSCRA